MPNFSDFIWCIPLLYLLIFLIGLAIGKANYRATGLVNIILSCAALLMSTGVFWERAIYASDDYSYNLEWLVIGDSVFEIGYELNNIAAWLLLLIASINILLLLLLHHRQAEQPSYGYIGLLLFATSALILADDMFMFLACGLLSSCIIYLWLAHPFNSSKPKAIFRFVTAQLIGFSLFFIALVGLYWYMPEHSLQFTMLETVFSGPAPSFTPFMKNTIAFSLVTSALVVAGVLPYTNWMKHIDVERSFVRVVTFCFAQALLPTIILLKFSIVIGEQNDILWLCKCIGAFIVIWCTFRMLLNAQHTLAYIGLMQLGTIAFAFGHGLYSYILLQITMICLSMIVVYGSVNYSSSIIVYGAFLVAILTLIGVPPLSGYWLQQSLVATISTSGIGWNAVALVVVLCSSLSMTIYFVTFWKNSNGNKLKLNWRAFFVVIPALIIIGLGLLWLVDHNALELWLYDETITNSMQLMPMLFTMISVGIGVVIAWMFSERITETFAASLEKVDNQIKTKANNIGYLISIFWEKLVDLERLIERGLVHLFTIWLPYPIRFISKLGASGKLWHSIALVLLFTIAASALWVGVRGR